MVTRHLWIERCAQRYVEVLGLDDILAKECAVICAHAQDETRGTRTTVWDVPEAAAEADIRAWEIAPAYGVY